MARVGAILYGLVAYAAFLGAFLYAIGFLAGVLVPRGIDDPPLAASWHGWVVNLLLLGLFAVQHSLMARRWFKAWWTRFVPSSVERSTYVLLASLILFLVYWQWRAMPAEVWHVTAPILRRGLWTLYALGWVLVLVASFLIDHFELFGLRQVVAYCRGRTPEAPRFRTPGLYRLVRHPLYLGFFIAFWATPQMTVGHLLFAVVTSAYILVAVVCFEEPDLVRLFGDSYRQYRRRVPMFLPIPRRRADTSPGAHPPHS